MRSSKFILGILAFLVTTQTWAFDFKMPWVNRPVVSEPIPGVLVITTETSIFPARWAELDAYSDNEAMREIFIEVIQHNGRKINTSVMLKIDVQRTYVGPVSGFPGRVSSNHFFSTTKVAEAIFDATIKMTTGVSTASTIGEQVLKHQESHQSTISDALPLASATATNNARMALGKLCYQDYTKCGEFAALTVREDISDDELLNIATRHGAPRSIRMHEVKK